MFNIKLKFKGENDFSLPPHSK